MARPDLLRPDFPFQPANKPFYYGWWVLLGVVLTQVLSSPGQTAGISPFVEPLMEAAGLSRQSISNAYLVGTLLSGICMLRVGKLIDRMGSRLVNLSAGILMAGVLLILSQVDRILSGMAYVIGDHPTVVGGMVLIVLGAGFFSLRFCGQGAMTLAAQTTTPRWFKRRRGLATGVAGFVGAIIGPTAPLLLNILIGLYGWRGAWIAAAVIVLIANSLVALVIWRDTPESCGLVIDGKPVNTDRSDEEEIEETWTRAEAIRAPAFWIVALTNSLLGMIITAISFHIIDIGRLRGLDDERALTWFIPMAWTGMVVGLGANILADRASFRLFLPAFQIFLAGSSLSLALSTSATGFYLSAIVMGLALAMTGPASVTTFPRWFGRTHLGSITGVNWAGTVIGSAIGPALFGLLHSTGSGYRTALIASAVPLMVLFILTWLVASPVRRA